MIFCGRRRFLRDRFWRASCWLCFCRLRRFWPRYGQLLTCSRVSNSPTPKSSPASSVSGSPAHWKPSAGARSSLYWACGRCWRLCWRWRRPRPAHLISWQFRASTNLSFDLPAYYYSAPWRILLTLAVFVVDIYLGLHWLAGGVGQSRHARQKLSALAVRGQGGGVSHPPSSLAPALLPQEPSGTLTPALSQKERENDLRCLLVKRSRAAMLGRLLWQHWRQSWPLMLSMSTVFVVFGSLSSVVWSQIASSGMSSHPGDHAFPLWSIGIFSTLIGTTVFLSDPERRKYRFFAEHNVPPSYI